MIAPTMAVTTAAGHVSARAEYAHDARLFRLGALFVDTLIFGAISFVVNSVYGMTQPNQGLTIGAGPYSTTVAWPWLTLLGILYFTVPEAMFGATPGKAWARLRVVRLDGRPLSLGSVIVRNLLKPIDFLPLLYLLGGVLVLVAPGSQRLGDIAAGTTVVFRHRAREPGVTRSSTPPANLGLAAVLLIAVLFTIAFDYVGRPPLVIAGDYATQRFEMRGVQSYSLGSPHRGWGQVTYPIKLVSAGAPLGASGDCSGWITLDWGWLEGWNSSYAGWSCAPTR